MIEVFNVNRTISLGYFKTFRAAKGTLTALADAKKLGKKPAVMVCSYKSNEPQQEYIAAYSGKKWHLSKCPKTHQFA